MKRHSARLLALVASCLSLLVLTAPVASAEEMDYPSPPITVAPSTPPKKGATTQVAPADQTFQCDLPYVVVQAKASGYATGNCKQGTHLRRELKSDSYNTHYWEGGWVFGNYSGCGWVQDNWSSVVGSLTEQLCGGNVNKENATYQRANNNATGPDGGCSWKVNDAGVYRCTNGTNTTLATACNAYGNFRPWLSGQSATDFVRSYPAGKVLRWRYVTKYNAPNGRPMVLVRDDSYADGQGNWLFVDSGCIYNYPGATTDVS